MCADTMRTQNTLCAFPDCRRTVWHDPDGSYSSYCGNAHRLAMQERQVVSRSRGGRGRGGGAALCQNCKTKPVYVQDGHAHPFCGLRCAQAFAASPPASRQNSNQNQNQRAVVQQARCILNGCRRNVYVDHGVPTRFCGNEHRRQAVQTGQLEGCLLCMDYPRALVNGKASTFCSRTCSESAINAAPLILQIAPTDTIFKNVRDQFTSQWKHPSSPGNVVRIWRIIGSRAAHDSFSRYQHGVERRTGIQDGNARRRWHGTVRNCRLGDDDHQSTLCRHIVDGEVCALCAIIRSSFEVARAGERTNFGRFGAGIYTSATSSKANDYVHERAPRGGSPYRAMLLNDVILGKTCKLTVGDETLTAPPPGYDSVIGEPGGDLNYDESIVYNNDAIRPLFLVIFEAV